MVQMIGIMQIITRAICQENHTWTADRMFPVETDLSDLYNDGVAPPPELAREPIRLQPPSRLPITPAQVETARRKVARNSAILLLLICACLALLVLVSGWIP